MDQDDLCPVCGEHEDECTEDCDCPDCQNAAERAYRARVEDGEAFRGGEAAAYERERQAHIQRTLK